MTGYTHRLVDEKQNFSQFVLSCARAFLIDMRDRTGDIPLSFDSNSYYEESLAEDKAKLAALEAMTPEQQLEYGKAEKAQSISNYENLIESTKATIMVLQEMLDQVKAWTAPSSDHINLKRFMIEQLEDSIRSEHLDSMIKGLEAVKAEDEANYYPTALKWAKRDVERSAENLEKEVTGLQHTNKWIATLRASL